MGIYISGMEMPERCEDCFCYRHNAEYDYSYCNISAVNVRVHGQQRLNNCPLVPVPPHGRLIDADALIKKGMPLSFSVQKWVQEVDIACAPTIIPASKEVE